MVAGGGVLGAGRILCFILGGPGSGKTVQSELAARKLGFDHFSAGALLRQFAAGDDATRGGDGAGQTERERERVFVRETLASGNVVPSRLTVSLLQDVLRASSAPSGVLIDGFPRCEENREAFVSTLGKDCDACIVLDCAEATSMARLNARNSGREDDSNLEAIRTRMHFFDTETRFVLAHYARLGILKHVNAELSTAAVQAEFSRVLSLSLHVHRHPSIP